MKFDSRMQRKNFAADNRGRGRGRGGGRGGQRLGRGRVRGRGRGSGVTGERWEGLVVNVIESNVREIDWPLVWVRLMNREWDSDSICGCSSWLWCGAVHVEQIAQVVAGQVFQV